MRYGSVCSGIEAATAAWHPLGWEPAFFSEIEKFPRAVLEHHYPETPLHGDFTTIGEKDYAAIDLLVGGTPCQSFSIAGLRKGLDDDRGNLALEFIRLANRKRAQWLVWENVPGVFSSSDGEDFRCFLAGLSGWNVRQPEGGWQNSGVITPAPGGYGICWRVLDAQYFGVAQRRRRVFVVAYLGGWRPAAAVLFERHSLQGHPAPSREKGQRIAETPNEGATAGRLCERTGRSVSVQDAQKGHIVSTFAGNQKSVVASTIQTTCDDYSRADSFNVVVESDPALNCNRDGAPIAFQSTANACDAAAAGNNISPSLRKSAPMAIAFKPGQSADARSIGAQEEVACTLEAGGGGNNRQAVAFGFNGDQSAKARSMGDREEQSPTLRSEAPSHVAVAFTQNQRDEVRQVEVPGALSAQPGMKQQTYVTHAPVAWSEELTAQTELAGTIQRGGAGGRHDGVYARSAVRRLTPTECERLQGFPDGFTAIPWRGKGADACPDGPRYKALGNSMAVPVMRWIGQRIDQVNEITGGECHQCKGTGKVCCGGKEGYFECCANTVECTECGRATA